MSYSAREMKSIARHVVVGVTGSIAAYKSAELVRLLKKQGWNVSVIMTQAATRFVGELTFRTLSQNPVGIDMFDVPDEWCPEHISMADWADAVLIAPCTANVIAKIAHGIADDLLSATVLASCAPLMIAPAMNEKMWKNAATQSNIHLLKSRGISIVDVESGELACGCQGQGRMAPVETILKAFDRMLQKKRPAKTR